MGLLRPNVHKMFEKRDVSGLVKALKDETSAVRETAARTLGKIKDPRAVEPLISALKDGDSGLRTAAAGALGEIEDARAIEPLIAGLKDESSSVRWAAASALYKLPDARTVEPLIAGLKDESSSVREAAAHALGRVRDARAVEPLVASLKDENRFARRAAVFALGDVRDARAVEPLIATLGDGDSDVRVTAAQVLGYFKEARTVDPLIAALKHDDSHLRWAAAQVLGRTDDPRAVKALAAEAEKAAKLKAMEDEGRRLRGQPGPGFGIAFDGLFADLMNDDPDIRAKASELLADNAPQGVASVYQECLSSDPRRAGLAGRVLGRKAAKGPLDMIPAQVAQVLYGLSASFLPCPCAHCGHQNRGIAAPPNGPMVGYYSQKDDTGAYAVPVLCDGCGKEFFVVWDSDPR